MSTEGVASKKYEDFRTGVLPTIGAGMCLATYSGLYTIYNVGDNQCKNPNSRE